MINFCQYQVKMDNHILIRKTTNPYAQFIRYAFVGLTAFSVDYGILIFLTEIFKIYYLLSACLSFIAGVSINYLLSVKWVFTHRKIKNRYLEFIIFAIIGLIGLGLNTGFLWIFTEKVHIDYRISKLIATFLVFIWNFTARKLSLFQTPKEMKNE